MVSALLVLLHSCADPEPAPEQPSTAQVVSPPAPAAPAPPKLSRPSAPPLPRLVALGDLHADLAQALEALRLLSLVDAEGRWAGGTAVLVQTGDITDRGPESKDLIELMRRLVGEAAAAGGQVLPLLGNHEVMNMAGDWRYVTPEDIARFGGEDARRAALADSGELGAWLREQDIVAIVDGVVFCHGGLTPEYARMGLDRLNTLAPLVLSGKAPKDLLGERSPIWYRGYLQDPEPQACAELEQALGAIGAWRMVVGHTTQESGRILSRCQGRILGIDTGIAAHYGKHTAALEILDGDARALYPAGPEDLPDPSDL